jgi:hypothetical protein
MTDSNRSLLRFLKPSRNGHSPNGAGPHPRDWPGFKTSIEKRKLLADVETQESELHGHRVDVNRKILDGRLYALVVFTGVGGEIVLLAIRPALFLLNLPGLFAYRWWKEKKHPPDEHGGGP